MITLTLGVCPGCGNEAPRAPTTDACVCLVCEDCALHAMANEHCVVCGVALVD